MEEELKTLPPWSLPIRIAVLVLLMLYLSIVVLAPMTNPTGAPQLTTPIAQKVAPVHQALYLNHGYRFFAPNPGPSDIVVYEIETADGGQIKGRFPDRDNTSPRLLYHRWFMLSGSVFRQYANLSLDVFGEEQLRKVDERIAALANQGEMEQSKALANDRDQRLADWERFDGLMLNLARNLVAKFGESAEPIKSIRMWIYRRAQPAPEQSIAGLKLTDESLITQAEVAYFTGDQLADLEQVVAEPELETISAGGGDE